MYGCVHVMCIGVFVCMYVQVYIYVHMFVYVFTNFYFFVLQIFWSLTQVGPSPFQCPYHVNFIYYNCKSNCKAHDRNKDLFIYLFNTKQRNNNLN